jgi:uncharacterized protein
MMLYSLKGWPDADDLFTLAVILPLALFAGTIGGTVGFGSAVTLIPVLAYYFGTQTVPILTVATLLGNLSRAAYSWRDTNWRAFWVCTCGAVPSAILGAMTFVEIDPTLLHRLLELFILSTIPASHLVARFALKVQLWPLFPIGIVMGLLSGVVGTVGPINAPFFLSCGLVKGARCGGSLDAWVTDPAQNPSTLRAVERNGVGRAV